MTRKAALTADLAAQDQPAPAVLHSKATEVYCRQVADLEAALNDPEVRMEASDALRSLIEKVVFTPPMPMPRTAWRRNHTAIWR